MSDDFGPAVGKGQDGQGIVWPQLAAVWGGALLARAVIFGCAFVATWASGYSISGCPPVMAYLVFVPSSVVCALVAGWAYPRQPLLAAAIPLLVPPDYGAPAGIVVAVALWLGRTRTQRWLVTAVALLLMVIIYLAPYLRRLRYPSIPEY